MAALKSTAKQHRRARATVVSDVGSDVGISRRAVEQHVRSLRVVLDILIVCDMALRMQGAEQDVEVADVLRHCGSERLSRAVEEVDGMIGHRNAS